MKITELDKRPNVWTTTVTGPDDSEWRNMTLAKDEDMNWKQFSSSGPKTKKQIAAWKQARQNRQTAKPKKGIKDHHPDQIKEETDATLDSIVERYPTELESVLTGNSFLYDHDKFYDELYEYFVTGAGRGEMPYGVAKARDGDPDEWITEYLEQEFGREFGHGDPELMDGDFDSAMASAGHGTDEDYGYYGEGKSHSCATHVEHKEFGKGRCIPAQHSLIETGKGEYKVTHYDVKFGSGIKKNVSVEELKIVKESHHSNHSKSKKVKKESSWDPRQMREYADIISESSKKKKKITTTRMPIQAPFKIVEGHTGKRKKRS